MPGLQAAQRDILTYAKGHPDSAVFHSGLILEIKDLNVPIFQRAIEAITLRHDALRSYFSLKQLEPTQHVHPSESIDLQRFAPLQHIDATGISYTKPLDLEQSLQKLGVAWILNEPFQLDKAPLWRSALVRFDETTYQFLLLVHHTIIDGTSFDILFNDISAYYNAFLQNTSPNLPAVPRLDEHLVLEQPDAIKKKRLAYWEKTLAGLNVLSLPTDKQENGSFAYKGKRHHFDMNADLITSLKKAFPGQSINNLFLAALSVLCYRYTGGNATDICLGTTSANRRHNIANIDQLVHCLFNSLAIRLTFSPSTSFENLLLHIKQQIRDALQNQLSQTEIYQHALSSETKRGLHTASPFSIMFTASPFRPPLNLNGASASHPVEPHIGGHTRFSNFGIYAEEHPDLSLACFLEYNTERFEQSTIERAISHLLHIFKTISAQPDILIKDICLLQPEELLQITEYNNTSQPSPFLTLHDALHETAKRIPNNQALVFHSEDGLEATPYLALDTQSTKLANYLLSIGCQPGQLIGVCLPRSLNAIVAIFGVLKAGMVLVTLETQPDKQNLIDVKAKQLNYVIADNNTKKLVPINIIINLHDKTTMASIQSASSIYVRPNLRPDSPAYVMYSSGTTGEPKGTLIAHRGLSNLISAQAKRYPHDTRTVSTAEITFDAALFDLGLLAALGNTVYFTTENNRYSPHYLNRLIKEHNIEILVLLPDILKELDPTLPSVKSVTNMGNKPDIKNLRDRWKKIDPSRTVLNGYGPTEYTVCTSLYEITDNPDLPGSLIGQPIQNTKIFIVDTDNLLCPMGVPGQLVITGPGVALGYTNNPEQNERAFKTLRFNDTHQKLIPAAPDEPGAMPCYFTGDLGCYFPDHDGGITVNFISRINREKKIRGVPVNLDVLENTLHQHPEVQDVFIHTKDNETLSAFIIPTDLKKTENELKLRRSIHAFLLANTTLPRVAYPRDVIILHEFILNANGKIDIPNLPYAETIQNISLEALDTLHPLEAELLRLWSVVLRLPIDKIEREDSFHFNGGDSILTVELESLLNNHERFTFTPPITAGELLTSTIKSLATALEPRHSLKPSPLIQNSVFSPPQPNSENPVENQLSLSK